MMICQCTKYIPALCFLLNAFLLPAQERGDTVKPSELPFAPANPYRHRSSQSLETAHIPKEHTFGFGVNISEGDASTGRTALMLSALYSYRISPNIVGEASIQQIIFPMDAKHTQSLWALSTATMFDITMMTTPIHFLPRFRCGIGSSIRRQQSGIKYDHFSLDTAGQSVVIDKVNFQNTVAAGLSLKLEYLHSVSPAFDIALRAQGHLFAPPFIGHNDHVPANMPGGSASVGVFVLIHR